MSESKEQPGLKARIVLKWRDMRWKWAELRISVDRRKQYLFQGLARLFINSPKRRLNWRSVMQTSLFRWLKTGFQSVLVILLVGLSAWGSYLVWAQFPASNPALAALSPCVSRPGMAPEMALIPGGKFMMGSPVTEAERGGNERLHQVTVESFAIGRCEVTFAEYDAFAESTKRGKPYDEGWGRGRRPVINVSWNDALAYADWLSKETGQQYRLPTEAEWEYAARAGATTAFWWGDTINPEQANYDGTAAYNGGETGIFRGRTLPVGSFNANSFGLYGVHGNVLEWTCSAYEAEYGGDETRCAYQGAEGSRVLRGGSWGYDPWGLRSAGRSSGGAGNRFDIVGFRLARAVP